MKRGGGGEEERAVEEWYYLEGVKIEDAALLDIDSIGRRDRRRRRGGFGRF